jgi:hypothetical protein
MPKGELSIWESKEGIRRLSIVAGIVGLILWTIFFLFGFLELQYKVDHPWGNTYAVKQNIYVMRYTIGLPFSYILPWGLIKLIKWILDGFRHKKDIKEEKG